MQRWIPYALLSVASLLAIASARYVMATTETQAEVEFQTDSEDARRQILVRINTYVEVVRAGAALLASNNELNGAEFRAFVASLKLRERYPGMVGIGFSQGVRRADLQRFQRAVRLDGVPSFGISPRGVRPRSYPVVFLEPPDARTQAAIGFDIGTDEILRTALERARDTGEPTVSGRVTGEQPFGNGDQAQVVLCVPVYRASAPDQSVDARRRSLVGFVFSPFEVDDLLQSVVSTTAPSIAFDVYDGAVAASTVLLKQSGTESVLPRFHSVGSMQVGGRNWLVDVRSSGTLRAVPQAARDTLIAGLLLSLMLFVITRAQVRAWETAVRQEAEIRSSEEALRENESQLRRMVDLEREARTRAQAADHAKDEFLATVSHELRTPLNAMLGWISMLRSGLLREDRRAHAVEVIERNAHLQAKLIQDLLEVSRIIMGQVRLDLRPLAVGPVVAAALESLRPSAEAKGLQLHGPVAGETLTISGDPDRVQQVVWNLVSNAIKFTPAGGSAYVELEREDEHMKLSVRDTGTGIVPEFLPHVFERFRQADSSATRQHHGIGLGLAIAQHLVKLHGGSIEAHSEGLDRGALFVVRIPLEPDTAAIVTAHPEQAPLPSLQGVRVLLVEDDPDTRELLTGALDATGARVTSAESADQALELLSAAEGANLDVLVSDIVMPDQDGYSLMRRIRSLPGDSSRIPAIALTARAHQDDRALAEDAGYQMQLAKPVNLAELQAGVAELTRQYGSRM